RGENILRRSYAGSEQALANQPVFLSREDMRADGKRVAVGIDQLEGKHSSLSLSAGARRRPLGLEATDARRWPQVSPETQSTRSDSRECSDQATNNLETSNEQLNTGERHVAWHATPERVRRVPGSRQRARRDPAALR